MLADVESNQKVQEAFNARLQSQVDTMVAGMDVKLELLCQAVKELTVGIGSGKEMQWKYISIFFFLDMNLINIDRS